MDLRFEAAQFASFASSLDKDPADAAWTEIVTECKRASDDVVAAVHGVSFAGDNQLLAEMMLERMNETLKQVLTPPRKHAKKYEGAHAADARRVVRQIDAVWAAAGLAE